MKGLTTCLLLRATRCATDMFRFKFCKVKAVLVFGAGVALKAPDKVTAKLSSASVSSPGSFARLLFASWRFLSGCERKVKSAWMLELLAGGTVVGWLEFGVGEPSRFLLAP
jgi:hypothetical protein